MAAIIQPGDLSSCAGFAVDNAADVPSGAACRKRGGRFVPVRHDGFVVGNGELTAVLGWKSSNAIPFISSMSFIDVCAESRPIAQVLADELISEHELSLASSVGEAAQKGLIRLLPAQDFAIIIEEKIAFSGDFPICVARRLRKSGIWLTSCERGDLRLEILDFAPLSPVLPVVVRMVTVKAKTAFGPANLLCFLKDPGLRSNDGCLEKTVDQNALAVSSPGCAVRQGLLPGCGVSCSWIDAAIPALAAGQSATVPFYFSVAGEPGSARAAIRQVDKVGPGEAAAETRRAWAGLMTFDFRCGNDRLEDLIEGTEVLLLSERMRSAGFWAGVCRYPASYIRDNYYALRGLASTGHAAVSRDHLLDLQERLKTQPLTNIYLGRHGAKESPLTFWNDRNEVSSYAALMARDYVAYSGDTGAVKAMLPRMVESLRNVRTLGDLSMSHGDETHHWTMTDFWINAGSIDTSILDLAALRYLQEACTDINRPDLLEGLSTQEASLRQAIQRAWLDEQRHYPAFVFRDGAKDPRPCLNTLLFGFYCGVHGKWSPDGAGCLAAALRLLSMPNGLPMSSVDFPIYSGNTPGLLLSALAESDNPRGEAALAATMDLASATGTYIEYYDIYEHRPYGETMRAIEGGCVLAGIVDYLFGIRPLPGGIRVKPHLPSWLAQMSLNDFRVADAVYTITVEPRHLHVEAGDLSLTVDPVCELEIHEHSSDAPDRARIILRPAEEAAPRELEFMAELGIQGHAEITPGGFASLTLELGTKNGSKVSVRQDVSAGRVVLENRGAETLKISGKECAAGTRLELDMKDPLAVTAFTADYSDAGTARFFNGEGFRVSGWLRRGRFPSDASVKITHQGDSRVIEVRGGRFTGMLVAPSVAGRSEVRIEAMNATAYRGDTIATERQEARASIEIATQARDVAVWKEKALAGYTPCVVHASAHEGLAQVLAMELSLLMAQRVSVIAYDLKRAALVIKPSCENARAEPQAGDLALCGQGSELPGLIDKTLQRIRLAWQQTPLLTTDEWKIKATRYAMMVASRSLSTPHGKIPGFFRAEVPASRKVCGSHHGSMAADDFEIDLDTIGEGAATEAELSISVQQPLPQVRQVVVACAGKRNHYTVGMLLPPHLRVVDPTIDPRPGAGRWRGAVQALHVTRDPATLRQRIALDMHIEDGLREEIALTVVSL